MPIPRSASMRSSAAQSPREASTVWSTTSARASEVQNRLPGLAKGAFTAAVQGLGLIPTMSNRSRPADSRSVGKGNTSSRPDPAAVACAISAFVGRRPPNGDALRQGFQSAGSNVSMPNSLRWPAHGWCDGR